MLQEFLRIDTEDSPPSPGGVTGKTVLKLKDNQIESLRTFQKSGLLKTSMPLTDNLSVLITRKFVKNQVSMLDGLILEDLSPNPFLIQSLNLKTAHGMLLLS